MLNWIDKIDVREIRDAGEKVANLQQHALHINNYAAPYAFDFLGEDHKVYGAFKNENFLGFSRLAKFDFLLKPGVQGPIWGFADAYFPVNITQGFCYAFYKEIMNLENVQVGKCHISLLSNMKNVFWELGFTDFFVYPGTSTAIAYCGQNNNIKSELNFNNNSIEKLDSPEFCKILQNGMSPFGRSGL